MSLPVVMMVVVFVLMGITNGDGCGINGTDYVGCFSSVHSCSRVILMGDGNFDQQQCSYRYISRQLNGTI